MGSSLAYSVPAIEDLEGHNFVVSCDLGAASSFVNFDGSSFSSEEAGADQIGNYTIVLTIEDSEGASTAYTLLVKVEAPSVSEGEQVQAEEQQTPNEEESDEVETA